MNPDRCHRVDRHVKLPDSQSRDDVIEDVVDRTARFDVQPRKGSFDLSRLTRFLFQPANMLFDQL